MIDYGVNVPSYLECMPYSIYVDNIEFGERKLKNGFYIPEETMDHYGHFARPRWARIRYKSNDINFLDIGDWILLSHGRWSTSMLMEINGKIQKLWYISPKSIKEGLMAVSKNMPEFLKQYGIEENE